MKDKIALFVALFLISSCTAELIKSDTKKSIADNDDWVIIEKIESEKWSRGSLTNSFGAPDKNYRDENQPEFLIYNYKNTDRQKWGFEIDEKEKVISITFIPNASNRENFRIEKITQKWGASCAKKKEVDSSQHFIKNIYYLDCGKKHRAYLNRYDEVTSLAISVL